jgi:hypothetical protein
MTGIAAVHVQATNPALVLRASEDFAVACPVVFGQECFGSAAAVWQVESVSGVGLAGAAASLGLVALGEAAVLLEQHGYVGRLGQERPQIDGRPQNDGSGTSERDYDSSKGDNGSKPMTLWDFRTSSPPG